MGDYRKCVGRFSMSRFSRAGAGEGEVGMWVMIEMRRKVEDQEVVSFIQLQSVCRRSPFFPHCLQQRLEDWYLKRDSLSGVRYQRRVIVWENSHVFFWNVV